MVVQRISWKNLKTKTGFAVATWTAGKLFLAYKCGALHPLRGDQIRFSRYRLTRNISFFVIALHVSVIRPSSGVCSCSKFQKQ
jgi:hypothetical protein